MKKFITVCVSIAMLVSIATGAYATSYEIATSTSDEEFNKYTIDFSVLPNAISAASTNEDKVERARQFVYSLDLDKQGFEEIQDACLSRLETLGEELDAKNASLQTYSVLVPKSNSYTFYGSYEGKSFYSSFYDEYTYEIERNMNYDVEMLQAWANGTVNAVMLAPIAGAGWKAVTISWTAFSSALGIPQLYEIHNKAYLEHFAIIDVQSRGIFWKDGSSTYKLVYSDEKAKVSPYIIFHTIDSSLHDSAPTYNCVSSTIYSDNYYIERLHFRLCKLCRY